MKKILIFIAALFFALTSFLGCTPSQFKKGVEVDENYPEDVLEIYDDAVVFESEERFGKVRLSLGTNDDIDDISDYYRDFYEYKNITVKETLEDDEYSATFVMDGYEFDLKAEKSSGDAKKYFEYVIEIKTKKLDEQSSADGKDDSPIEASATADSNPSQNIAISPTVAPTAPPSQKTVLDGETALSSIALGAWYSYSVSDSQSNDKYVDYTISFADDTTGSYYYFDYALDEKMNNDFTYEIVNGVLVINLDNNVQLLYDAYYDNDQLHLLNQYTDEEMYLKNWQKESGKTPNIGVFTAYGSWIAYPEGFNSPICLALWKDGAGYIYNWNNDAASDNIMWEISDNQIKFEVGTLYGDTLALSHRANVLVATTSADEEMCFYRATTNTLHGVYEMSVSSNSEVSSWTATLYPDQNATHKISTGLLTFNYENSDWYINPVDGMLYAFIFGEYANFYYYYNESQLILKQSNDNLEYTFDKTSN